MNQSRETQQIITTVVKLLCCQHGNPGVLTAASCGPPLSFASIWVDYDFLVWNKVLPLYPPSSYNPQVWYIWYCTSMFCSFYMSNIQHKGLIIFTSSDQHWKHLQLKHVLTWTAAPLQHLDILISLSSPGFYDPLQLACCPVITTHSDLPHSQLPWAYCCAGGKLFCRCFLQRYKFRPVWKQLKWCNMAYKWWHYHLCRSLGN